MTPEGKVKTAFKRELKKLDTARVWSYMPVPGGRGKPAHDMILCAGGHFVSIEFKAPGKHLTPLQEETRTNIVAAGGTVMVVDDIVGIGCAIAILKGLASGEMK